MIWVGIYWLGVALVGILMLILGIVGVQIALTLWPAPVSRFMRSALLGDKS